MWEQRCELGGENLGPRLAFKTGYVEFRITGFEGVRRSNAPALSDNGLHWIRDVAFAEDHCQVRTGHGPRVMATFRNLSWPRSVTSPSASTAYAGPPTLLPPAGRSAETQTESCR